MKELRDKLYKELEELKKRNLSTGSIELIDKITHSIKSIDTIEAMQNSGYSNGYNHASYDMDRRGRNGDGSYAYDYSNRMRKDGGRDQRYSYGYSRDLKSDLEDMLRTAQGKEREIIEHAIRDLH